MEVTGNSFPEATWMIVWQHAPAAAELDCRAPSSLRRWIDGAHPSGHAFESLDGEVHRPVTVLEPFIAHGVDPD
jgi:hypothetical protein